VVKSKRIDNLKSSLEENLKNETFEEKFEEIKEWNELRLRVGDANTFLENGSYLYHIQLEIPLSISRQNLIVLQNWTDPIGFLEVQIDGQIYCNNGQIKPNCNSQKTQIVINPNKDEMNILVKFLIHVWLNIWIYLISISIALIWIYLGWRVFSKDTDCGFINDKPEFDPPNLLPWQTQFLLNENVDLTILF
jgi:hypothetical protein